MRLLLFTVALLALVASTGRAQAERDKDPVAEESGPLRWVRIGATNTDTLWYDPETVRTSEPNVYRVWVLESRGRGGMLPTGEAYALVRELSDFDCDAGRSRRRELLFYTRDEALVKSYTWAEDDMEWREPLPRSDVEFIVREVCERVR